LNERSGNVIENKAPHFLEGTGAFRIAIPVPDTGHSRAGGNPARGQRVSAQWIPGLAGVAAACKLNERSGNVIENKAPHFLEAGQRWRVAQTCFLGLRLFAILDFGFWIRFSQAQSSAFERRTEGDFVSLDKREKVG
jgi:hypothetical protein